MTAVETETEAGRAPGAGGGARACAQTGGKVVGGHDHRRLDGGHDDRVLRLLRLWHRGGELLPARVLLRCDEPDRRAAALARHFRRRVPGPPGGLAHSSVISATPIGRKATLVVSLMTMGVATFLIGCLPGYDMWGVWAVLALCVCRFVRGIGLGGEWSGARSWPPRTRLRTSARCMARSPSLARRSGSSCATAPMCCSSCSTMTPRCSHGAGACRSCSRRCWWS